MRDELMRSSADPVEEAEEVTLRPRQLGQALDLRGRGEDRQVDPPGLHLPKHGLDPGIVLPRHIGIGQDGIRGSAGAAQEVQQRVVRVVRIELHADPAALEVVAGQGGDDPRGGWL